MATKIPRWLSVACLISITLVTATIAFFGVNLARSEEPAARKAEGFSPYVSNEGAISLPKDYRETFVHMGSWAVAKASDKPVDELHNVYSRAEDIKAFRRDGKLPDGAVLVKEVTNVAADKLTTGQSSWSTDMKVWFVMVKDSKGRFPGNDLWGDGWGWALFKGDDPAHNVATDYSTDCQTCHIPAKKDDWIYVRGYPVLGKHGIAR